MACQSPAVAATAAEVAPGDVEVEAAEPALVAEAEGEAELSLPACLPFPFGSGVPSPRESIWEAGEAAEISDCLLAASRGGAVGEEGATSIEVVIKVEVKPCSNSDALDVSPNLRPHRSAQRPATRLASHLCSQFPCHWYSSLRSKPSTSLVDSRRRPLSPSSAAFTWLATGA